ncbi:hypothetical protein [Candidatus Parabeggiatoa sp. HSG14]|uniref:hypothetical protein n=1 Tax=Candidatus Parabeggiatoa sp. HSG14 TaxID=3055593 RepID=UPI0025A7D95A|nr:hypothetical protein [Thiotrichales bacterium HSG14]
MNTQTTISETFKGVINSERTIALLGIAAHQQKSTVDTCPSDEELVAFSSGELKGKKRETMLGHLNHCQNCYHHWLETGSYIKYFPAEVKWWQKLGHVFLDYWKPLVFVPVTAILVMAISIKIFQPLNPIDASYVVATTHNPNGFNQILESLPLETNMLAFNETESSSSAQAFNAGIAMGKAKLTNTTLSSEMSHWANSQWADEYSFGRWCVLLWAMVQTPDKTLTDFWIQQYQIGEQLQARFMNRSSDDMTETVLDALTRIQILLTQLQKKPNNRGVTSRLHSYLEITITGISEL